MVLASVLLFLSFLIPAIQVRATEKTEYLSAYQWTHIKLTLPEDYSLNWEFETYDSPFQALVRIDDPDGYFENLITAESGSGVYVTEKQGEHTITLMNLGMTAGYIQFTYSDPPLGIPGYIPLLIVGVIGVLILGLIKKVKLKT